VRNDKNEGYTLEELLDFYEKNHSQEQQAMEELLIALVVAIDCVKAEESSNNSSFIN